MPFAQVNGRSLYYEDTGDGEPILFIHPFSGTLQAWGLLIPELRTMYRCIAYDQRDSGKSYRATEQYSIRDLADDAAGVIKAVGIAPCHVVGASMGGAVTQELAINYPELLRSATLIATYTKGDPRGSDNLRSWAKMRATFDRESFMRATLPWILTYREYFWPGFVEQRIRQSLEVPPHQDQTAYERQMEATLAHDAEDRLDQITVPTFVLAGEEDILAPLRFSRTLAAKIPNSRLMVLPEVSHGLLWVKPQEVKRAVLGFLRSLRDEAEPAP